jgi:hypothetical protein
MYSPKATGPRIRAAKKASRKRSAFEASPTAE